MAVIEANTPVEKQLNNEGYFLLPAIDESSIQLLINFYNSVTPQGMLGFHPTLSWDDSELKAEISRIICHTLSSYIYDHLPGFRLLYGSFMVKEPDALSGMKLHQDWAYVDEKKADSLAIWLPLVDLNMDNGALHIVPRSHLLPNYVRGPGVFCPFSEKSEFIIRHYSKPLYLKKGEPVVWNHRLLHYSPPNLSSNPRIAVTIILVPEESEVLHYFKPEESDLISEFSVSTNFYFNYTIGNKPDKMVTLKREFEHREKTYSEELLKNTLKKRYNLSSVLSRFF